MLRTLKMIFVCLFAVLCIAGLTGCKQEGTMEKAGKAVDEAVKETGEAAKEAQEKVEEAVEEHTDSEKKG